MSDMPSYDIAALRVLIALLIGCLIGLDRERAEVRKQRELFAGVRTFALVALTGAIPAMMFDTWGPLPLTGSLIAVAALALTAYLRSSSQGAIGATTEFAAVTTWLLGALAGSGHLLLAGGVAIAVAALLTSKLYLERFSLALSEQEISAAVQLGVVSCIVLPLLPNRGYGPWLALNPFEIWLVVVIVLALSFAALIAMRLLGARRGLLFTGLIGGLVSSTGVTVAMAHRARERPEDAEAAAQAAVLASAVMGVRVLIFAAVWGLGVLPRLAPALAALIAVSVLGLHLRMPGDRSATVTRINSTPADATPPNSTPPNTTRLEMTNPFSLRTALGFAIIFALVLLTIAGASAWLGDEGRVVAAAVSALADVDAVTIALARSGPEPDAWRTVAFAISMGVVANTFAKAFMVAVTGRGVFRRRLLWSLGWMALACGAVAILVYR